VSGNRFRNNHDRKTTSPSSSQGPAVFKTDLASWRGSLSLRPPTLITSAALETHLGVLGQRGAGTWPKLAIGSLGTKLSTTVEHPAQLADRRRTSFTNAGRDRDLKKGTPHRRQMSRTGYDAHKGDTERSLHE